MAPEKHRAPREKPGPYNRQPRQPKTTNKSKTAAKDQTRERRENLTLADWLNVFAFMDSHPGMSQPQIVRHFASLKIGSLTFSQSALSRNLGKRAELETRASSNPTALSSKRERVVTCPKVERALFLWVKHMENHQKETVTGPMLRVKREHFEKQMDIPMEQRLEGTGWIQSFCRAYNIKEIVRHGESASVDLEAVETERKRLRKRLRKYAPQDCYNMDETGFYAQAPPDRGLATRQMHGKKKDKFRITIAFACNADGSHKLEPLFIGKSKRPRCFKKKSGESHGLYYRNNKNAWMTSVLFEEWLKKLDLEMRHAKRFISLNADNFSGHAVSYEPTNIDLDFFLPNMTSFVQPMDMGIIRCFKALYRRALCERAVDMDEAGEENIYKIEILEAMKMAKEAWNSISVKTIQNCWNHAGILPSDAERNQADSESESEDPLDAPDLVPQPRRAKKKSNGVTLRTRAQDLIRQFAQSDDLTLPDTETALQNLLGSHYNPTDWQPALKAVMDAEGDVDVAVAALDVLFDGDTSKPSDPSTSTRSRKHASPTPITPTASSDQIQAEEQGLLRVVEELCKRKRIHGTPPTLEELINPPEEHEIGETGFLFQGGDDEIIAQVLREEAVENGEVMEVDEDHDEEEDSGPDVSLPELLHHCQILEENVLAVDEEHGLSLAKDLRQLRGLIQKQISANAKQTSISDFFATK